LPRRCAPRNDKLEKLERNKLSEEQTTPSPETNEEIVIQPKKTFFNYKTMFSFIFAFLVLFVLWRLLDFNLATTWTNIKRANPFLVIAALVVFYLGFPLRGLRWQQLLRNNGYFVDTPALTEIVYLSWFVNCIVPAKLGDLYRAFLLKYNYQVSMSKTVGTIFTERFIDMLAVFTLMGTSGLLAFRGRIPDSILPILEAGFVMALTLILGLTLMRNFGRALMRFFPWRIREIYDRFEEGIFSSFKSIPRLIILTVLIWSTEVIRTLLVVMAISPDLISTKTSLVLIIFVALAASLLTTLPLTPAGLGFVEGGMIGIFLLFGVPRETAVSIAIIDRSISYLSNIVFGLIVYLLSKKVRVNVRNASSASPV